MLYEALRPIFAKLERFLLRAGQDAYSGLPVPHEETHLVGGADALDTPATPTTVDAGSIGDIGDGPSFAREDHEHGVTTGTAVALGEAEAEGSGVALARAAHVHKLSIRVAKDGTIIGTRKRLNFSTTTAVSLSISDDSTNDEIDIVIGGGSVSGSASESLDAWFQRKAVEGYALREFTATNFR